MEPPLEHALFILDEAIDFMTKKNINDLHWGLLSDAKVVKI